MQKGKVASAEPQNSLLSSLTGGINKYLLALLLVFVAVIVVKLFFLNQNKPVETDKLKGEEKTAQAQTDTDDQTQTIPSAEYTPPPPPPGIDDLAQVLGASIFNHRIFEQIKETALKTDISESESRLEGVIVDVKHPNDGLALQIKVKTLSFEGQTHWVAYPQDTLSKIQVESGVTSDTLDFASLAAGDEVYIDERNKYTYDYPDSIVSVKMINLLK